MERQKPLIGRSWLPAVGTRGYESMGKISEPPRSVMDAVNRLLSRMTLREKTMIANCTSEDLFTIHSSLGVFIRNDFRIWSNNDELIESCGSYGEKSVRNADDATEVILKVLHEKLQETHSLRIMK